MLIKLIKKSTIETDRGMVKMSIRILKYGLKKYIPKVINIPWENRVISVSKTEMTKSTVDNILKNEFTNIPVLNA